MLTWPMPVTALQGTGAAEVAGLEEQEPPAAEDVAVVDPATGLLLMQPLPRCAFLLSKCSYAEVLLPVLGLLTRMATCGGASATQIVKCAGMCRALAALVAAGEPTGMATSTSALGQPGATAGSSSSVNTRQTASISGPDAVRVAALRLVRSLCQASPVAAQLLRTGGVLSHAQAALAAPALHAPQAAASAVAPVQQQLLQLEAMRIWRVTAAQVRV
jgi:hypothetical protein